MNESAIKYLLVVGGPTASGKTTLAIALAQHFNTTILSADSRQFYREMEIGTARPTATELAAAPHYFVADRSVDDPLNAGQFAEEALERLSAVFKQNNYAVLVGGSGLFIKALCEGLDTFPKVPGTTRKQVDKLFENGGLMALQEALKEQDPDYYELVDQQNPVRLQRALEVCSAGDKPYSFYLGQQAEKRPFTPIYIQPSWPREELYARINLRVDLMVQEGLEAEARSLQPQQHLASLQTVGYQEWFRHFAGELDRETTIALIKQNSRRYAKRQLSWNRRDGHWKSVPRADIRSALTYIHLVKDEGFSLVNASHTEQNKIISDRESRLGVELVNVSGKVVGSVNLLRLKDWVWLMDYKLEHLSYMAAMVLLHESLQRAEVPQVYAQPTEDTVFYFEQLGFTAVEPFSLPDKLNNKLISGLPVCRWERDQQLF